jgi:hypothetical protein
MLHPMDGDAQRKSLPADAAVLSGERTEGAGVPVGGPQASAPIPSVGLTDRHHAAVGSAYDRVGGIVETMSRDERWALLEAVVWPEAAELRNEGGDDDSSYDRAA